MDKKRGGGRGEKRRRKKREWVREKKPTGKRPAKRTETSRGAPKRHEKTEPSSPLTPELERLMPKPSRPGPIGARAPRGACSPRSAQTQRQARSESRRVAQKAKRASRPVGDEPDSERARKEPREAANAAHRAQKRPMAHKQL